MHSALALFRKLPSCCHTGFSKHSFIFKYNWVWCCHCKAGKFQLCRLIWLHSAGCPLVQAEKLIQAPRVNMPFFFFPLAKFQAADAFLCKSRHCCFCHWVVNPFTGSPCTKYFKFEISAGVQCFMAALSEKKTNACIRGITLCWRLSHMICWVFSQ